MRSRLLDLLTALSLLLCVALSTAVEYRTTARGVARKYSLGTIVGRTTPYSRSIGLPVNVTGMMFGILPAVRGAAYLRRHRQRRRSKHGQCSTCGYDLRATPGRCPECGTMATAPAAERSANCSTS